MSTQTATQTRVYKVLTALSGMEKITPEQSLTSDIGLSSLRMTELVIGIEDEFDILFKQSDMNLYKLKNVGDLIALVETYL